MDRYEVSIEGDQLGRAQAALNASGVPTIASGVAAEPAAGGGRMRRFFRSSAFPILLVIVLAFFAQRLISPGDEEATSYDQFLDQVEKAPASIDEVTLDPDDYAITVNERGGTEYETGYPPSAEEFLVNALRRQGIETVVEESGGGSILGLVTYILPFLLFFGFWLLLMNRSQRGKDGAPQLGGQVTALKAVIDADAPEDAAQRVQQALPPDGDYRTGEPKGWR